jgi:hypothetical protein
MPLKLRPMSEFDPAHPAVVHDSLNDCEIYWQPDWADHFREHAIFEARGTVGWDGRILDGWRPRILAI